MQATVTSAKTTRPWKQWEGRVVDGKFLLQRYLGGSEGSAVFLTERVERGLHKSAIKLVMADEGQAQAKLAQWALAAKLSHPHLLRIFHWGRCKLDQSNLVYVVTEFAEEDLAQILPQRPLTPVEAREMLPPVLDVLAYLHSKALIHGHLKPSNVMAVNEELRVSSDGLRPIGEKTDLRNPGAYDPPESATAAKSPAWDVWALGVTLVESLTQHLPAWERTKTEDPVIAQLLPTSLRDIVRGSLRVDPKRRCTISQIATRLAASSPLPPQRTPTSEKRSSRLPYAIASLVIAAIIFVGVVKRRNPVSEPREQVSPAVRNVHAIEKSESTSGSSKKAMQPAQSPAPSTSSLNRTVQDEKRASPKVSRDAQNAQPFLTSPPASPTSAKSATAQPPAVTARAPAPSMFVSSTPPSSAEAKAITATTSPGGVLDEVLPQVPQSALHTITGTVKVRLRLAVDSSGQVQEAKFDSPGPSKYFARLSMQAAEQWRFSPPQTDGRNVPSEWFLRFEFRRIGAKAVAMQAAR